MSNQQVIKKSMTVLLTLLVLLLVVAPTMAREDRTVNCTETLNCDRALPA